MLLDGARHKFYGLYRYQDFIFGRQDTRIAQEGQNTIDIMTLKESNENQ